MSTVIKNGIIVAADRSYKADILIKEEKIAAIGPDLTGDKIVDAEGALVMPGGIDPHTHLEMPFMGTTTAETWNNDGCGFYYSRRGRDAQGDGCLGGESGPASVFRLLLPHGCDRLERADFQ